VYTDLTPHHRTTVDKILSHPASGNIEWRQVMSLIEAIGTGLEEHSGNLTFTVGSQTDVLQVPGGKDIDEQMVVDLRRMLKQAGYTPVEGDAEGGSPT
jgi:hypothetical protein